MSEKTLLEEALIEKAIEIKLETEKQFQPLLMKRCCLQKGL
jgi:hypothetical protein